ncbi:hypothetical protein PCANC_26871 [Puccinia coronata f. sp. avenae]|uniref:Uncharacterized protein n=1 Tax=Puccinia coronata f. sp. avenae TaxID=200324 RepID=A0A2N5TLU1_9BASI|nr:hypothetical protein PCANC_26871 [Puccinia coronata f. sp. avenae]
MKHQSQIINLDASLEEIQQAVDDMLVTSNQYGDARAAFNEFKKRHEDVMRIEKPTTELMEMINDAE